MSINRKDLIDFLLRRRFGSLAPPPAPTLGAASLDARLAEARYQRDLAVTGKLDRRPAIEVARNEYEAMSAEELQRASDAARAEDQRKGKEAAERIRAQREAVWPRWAAKDLWSEAEFAALCCGFVPDERGMPGDPGRIAGSDLQAIAILRAADDIRRGTLAQTLAFVPRDDADTAARMYGTARHYVPVIAAEWAARKFNDFPASLLVVVREYAPKPEVTRPAKAIADKPLDERERVTLLCIIGALAKEAAVDLSQPIKAGEAVAAMVPKLSLTGRTIGEHLKKVSAAMDSRTK
ncbi:hypothetical protein [Xanthomonas hortorum]|uniref:Uncharacterized protein n=1 Tax=Xanthomonas hortorum pv. hederae TaxID=453603 RepID=A0A9X3YZC4_9XANT|nr:hypothetical protein [Xanthomonas hortorum]MDC8637046.1 hypothetical protein [Xanthomonas hortorum pv. hederae]